MQEEYLDLVNEKDQIIGRETRNRIYEQKLSNYRVVNAFIKDSKGKLWIPRRTADKKAYPLALDMSMGGHVESGENYEETFKRELQEELNINSETILFREIAYLKPGDHGVSSFMKIYEIHQNNTPSYNPADFVESFWLSPEEIIEKINCGDLAKGDLVALVIALYLKD